MDRGNRAFDEMRAAAVNRLAGRAPERMAAAAGGSCVAERGEIALRSLGTEYVLGLKDGSVRPETDSWHCLTLLHYLELSDGTEASPDFFGFGEMRDGMVRGAGFDRSSERALAELLSGRTQAELKDACAALGGTGLRTNADFSAVLPFFPKLALLLKVWFADDEFPASGRLLIGKNADHCLTVEDAVTVGEVLLSRLKCALDSGKNRKRGMLK